MKLFKIFEKENNHKTFKEKNGLEFFKFEYGFLYTKSENEKWTEVSSISIQYINSIEIEEFYDQKETFTLQEAIELTIQGINMTHSELNGFKLFVENGIVGTVSLKDRNTHYRLNVNDMYANWYKI